MKHREYYGQVYWDQLRSSSLALERKEVIGGLREALVQYLLPAETVLDIGCGDAAHYDEEFQQRVKLHVGIDLSFLALSKARRVGLHGVVSDLEYPLPFSSGVFEGIVCKEVLEHLFDPHSLLLEMHRVLKPRGILTVTVPNIAHFSHRLRLLGGKFVAGGHPDTADTPWCDAHIRFFTRRSLHELLTVSGFRPLEVIGEGTALLTSMPILSVLLACTLGRSRVEHISNFFNPLGRWWPNLFAGHLVVVARRSASG